MFDKMLKLLTDSPFPMKHENRDMTLEASEPNASISASEAFIVHSICGAGLAIALFVAHNLHSIALVARPSETLCLIWVPFIFFYFSLKTQKDQFL